MITDIDKTEVQEFYAHICIVGSGAAGIAIAREFIGGQTQVILLESGNRVYEQQTQSLYDSQVVGLPHRSIHAGRARIFGGTTTLWAGQVLPLNEIDFHDRDWVPESGWPFTRDHLEPFYRRAEKLMNLPAFSYDEREWPACFLPPPAFRKTLLQSTISQFSAAPNFSKLYYEELKAASNIHVLLHANAFNVQTNSEAAHVEQLDIKSLTGKTGFVKAKYYIICCGTIESARILLASNTVEKHGLGNSKDLVGRYFQDHLQYSVGRIFPKDPKHFMKMSNARKLKSIKYHPQFVASPNIQKQEKILNAIGGIVYPPSEESPIEAAKIILKSLRQTDLRPKLPSAIKNVLQNPDELIQAAYRYFVTKQSAQDTSGPPYLGIGTEQQPNRNSRIYLGDEVDTLGMRRVCLDWQLTELDIRTAEVFVRVIAQEFDRLELGIIELSYFDLPQKPSDLVGCVIDATHHIGTTRMSDTPSHGVVDSNCRIHGIDNLYIGSSAVFPTGGASNPTFTLLALCLRMADLLKQLVRE